MKSFFIALGILLSTSAFACPDLSGTYSDRSGESIVLLQKGCGEVSVLSRPLTHTLVLDNQFSVVQEDQDIQAWGRGIFEGVELVLEVKVIYKTDPGIPAMLRPVRAVNKYSQTSTGDLLEKSTIYNPSNSVLVSTKIVYKKQLNQ